jgi:hypothetical protein
MMLTSVVAFLLCQETLLVVHLALHAIRIMSAKATEVLAYLNADNWLTVKKAEMKCGPRCAPQPHDTFSLSLVIHSGSIT